MRITLRYFATLREARGLEHEEIDLPDGLTVRGVYLHLGLPAGLRVGFALNLEVVPPETAVSPGDELAFLPPLGGG